MITTLICNRACPQALNTQDQNLFTQATVSSRPQNTQTNSKFNIYFLWVDIVGPRSNIKVVLG
eukprot:12884411-Prorocentrum_lima.AAC.1